jgi:hypothetical protein
MEAIRSSETSGTTLRTTRRHIPEEDTLQPDYTASQVRQKSSIYLPFTELELLLRRQYINLPLSRI